jgi:hypothetical protein
MFNSLFIRDLLKQTNNDPARIERHNPHRRLYHDPTARPASGEFELVGTWSLSCNAAPEVAPLILRDAAEFLAAMGVALAPDSAQRIEFALDTALPARACHLECAPQHIRIFGGDIAGLWAGLAWLEWEMRTRRGPILPLGSHEYTAAWDVQISQGPYGGNYSVPDFAPEYLSDDAFRPYAHYGVNSMMIYGDMLCYVQSAIFPELNTSGFQGNLAMLQDAARRAARYGVQFSYLAVGPKLRAEHPLFQRLPEVRGSGRAISGGLMHCLCSSDEKVRDFYREFFSRLFHEVPELAGVICIIGGESFYHCRMWPQATEKCPRCYAASTEQVVSELMEVVYSAAVQAQPAAYVAAWPYNTSAWERPDRLQLVRRLPPGVAMYQAIEKDQFYRKDGYTKHIWDYSIDYTGPSDNMIAVAQVARETQRPLFVKTETGIGLEVFQFPYVPAMEQLADKWLAVRDLKPQGVQQSWLFYGMFGSRAEELGFWAAYRSDLSRDEFLRRMAVRDFGPDAAPHALRSWRAMSEAVRHLPSICLSYYYVGPSYLGPAHPLVPERGVDIPEVFYGYFFYLLEEEETFSRKSVQETKRSMVLADLPPDAGALYMSWDGDGDGWDIVVREYSAAATASRQAWKELEVARSFITNEMDSSNLREEELLTELFHRTMVSCLNTVRFLRARRDFERSSGLDHRERMRAIAEEEKENALSAAHIYEAAPWLDLAERTDGRFAPCSAMIEEKVRWIDRFIESFPRFAPSGQPASKTISGGPSV